MKKESNIGVIVIIVLVIIGCFVYDNCFASHWESISYLAGDYGGLKIRDDIFFKDINACREYVNQLNLQMNDFRATCGYRCKGEKNNASLDITCEKWG